MLILFLKDAKDPLVYYLYLILSGFQDNSKNLNNSFTVTGTLKSSIDCFSS